MRYTNFPILKSLRLRDDEAAWLREHAAAERIPESEVIRSALAALREQASVGPADTDK